MSALWVDKYRPQSLDRLDYHKDQAAQLARLAAAGDLPHMLFYGPSGAGKKTRVMALLRAIFGAGVERVKLQHRAFKTPSGKAIEVTTIASAYHIERVRRARASALAAVQTSKESRRASPPPPPVPAAAPPRRRWPHRRRRCAHARAPLSPAPKRRHFLFVMASTNKSKPSKRPARRVWSEIACGSA